MSKKNCDFKNGLLDKKREMTRKDESRRVFMKKAAYTVPTLFVLGSLARPERADAGTGRPPSAPSW